MSKVIPGRTDNGIKNRFHNLKRQLDREEENRLRCFGNVARVGHKAGSTMQNLPEDYMRKVYVDKIRDLPERLKGPIENLWNLKRGIGLIAAGTIDDSTKDSSSSCAPNTVASSTFVEEVETKEQEEDSGAAATSDTKEEGEDVKEEEGLSPSLATLMAQQKSSKFGPFENVSLSAMPNATAATTATIAATLDGGATSGGGGTTHITPSIPTQCLRCGFFVPSVQCGTELCTKTKWCRACTRAPLHLGGHVLRECLNLRRCYPPDNSPHTHKHIANPGSQTKKGDEEEEDITNEALVKRMEMLMRMLHDPKAYTNRDW